MKFSLLIKQMQTHLGKLTKTSLTCIPEKGVIYDMQNMIQ